jgi:hypothetical protein
MSAWWCGALDFRQGKTSLAGRFHFWDRREGRMVPYDKVYFYANGHISFVPPSGNTAFVPMVSKHLVVATVHW